MLKQISPWILCVPRPFLIAMVALAELSGCSLCKDEVLEKAASPDGKRVAIILTRDCGATPSEYIAVNVQDAKQRRLDEKTTFSLLNAFIRCMYSGRGMTVSQLIVRTAT